MSKVVNIQKGDYDVFIGRPSRFANPYVEGVHGDREEVVEKFRRWIASQTTLLDFSRALLPGKRLGCFCAPKMCHGHILNEIANGHWDHDIPEAPVFVFGSNLAGRKERGAAQVARERFGASPGIVRGATGHAYAIPVKDESLRPLSPNAILSEVEFFLEYAAENSDTRFKIIKLGCGLAEFEQALIRDRFLQSELDNLILPANWVGGNGVIIAGSRSLTASKLAWTYGQRGVGHIYEKLDRLLSRLDNPEIVSGAAKGIDTLGERYAADRGFPIQRFPAAWEWHGKAAGFFRNAEMAHYAPRLVAFKAPESRGTQNMIDQMRAAGGERAQRDVARQPNHRDRKSVV